MPFPVKHPVWYAGEGTETKADPVIHAGKMRITGHFRPFLNAQISRISIKEPIVLQQMAEFAQRCLIWYALRHEYVTLFAFLGMQPHHLQQLSIVTGLSLWTRKLCFAAACQLWLLK